MGTGESNCVKCSKPLPEGAIFCPWCGKKQVSTQRQGRKRANGEGTVFRYRAGWRVQVVLGYKMVNGKSVAVRRTKAGFKTKREAIEYLDDLRKVPAKAAPTLHSLWEEYQIGGYTKLSESRKEKYRIAWPKLEALHYCQIDLLTTGDLQREVNDHAKTFYPARDMRDLLSLLYKIAVANQYVNVNLAEYIELPPVNAKEQTAFTPNDLLRLWDDYGAGNWWTGYIILMCYTGMMPGELMACQQENVDLENRVIRGAGLKTDVRKSKPIVLAAEILPVLEDLMSRTTNGKLIQINKDSFYEQYYATLERIGLRRIVPYSCRHTTATTLADASIQPSVIQAIMRHANYATTQRYIHESVSNELTAADAITRQIARAKEKPPTEA